MSGYEIHGSVTIGAIGNGARSFVANGPMKLTTTGRITWLETTSTKVTASGIEVDMTDAAVDERRRVGGYVIVRTQTGVKARIQP